MKLEINQNFQNHKASLLSQGLQDLRLYLASNWLIIMVVHLLQN